jgi:hypothetical protein
LQLKYFLLAVGAWLAWVIYRDKTSADSGDPTTPSISIPDLVAPVATDSGCVGKTDAQGNWFGVNFSGNCTVEALGGETESW